MEKKKATAVLNDRGLFIGTYYKLCKGQYRVFTRSGQTTLMCSEEGCLKFLNPPEEKWVCDLCGKSDCDGHIGEGFN